MKSILATTVIITSLTAYVSSAQPSGSITNHVADPKNVLWDCTKLTNELVNLDFSIKQQVEVTFADPFTQDGKGKLSGGPAPTPAPVMLITSDTNQTFAGTYTTKGSITSMKGVARLTFSVKVTGRALIPKGNQPPQLRNVSVSETATVTLDAVAKTVTGRNVKHAMAQGVGSLSESSPISGTLPTDELGDGSWWLTITFGGKGTSNPTSSATVTLASGQVYPFSVSAPVTGHTGSKVTLTGTGAAAGSSLKVAFDAANQLASIVGKVSGQSINYKP